MLIFHNKLRFNVTTFCSGLLIFCTLNLFSEDRGPVRVIEQPPPPVTFGQCPVDFFIQLLDKSPQEREELLSGKSPEQRKIIQVKINEYLKYSRAERELRCRILKIRWYLEPILQLAPELQTQAIQNVPEPERIAVAERLKYWNLLPPPLKQEILKNDDMMQYFISCYEPSKKIVFGNPLIFQRDEGSVQTNQFLIQWLKLSVDERLNKIETFKQYFSLTPKEKTNVLARIPLALRKELAAQLNFLENMDPAKRADFLDFLEYFSRLKISEQEKFFLGLNRWFRMSPEQRKNWKELTALVPPLPPGLLLSNVYSTKGD